MQTCSMCNASSPDTARTCVQCGVNMEKSSATAVALKNLRSNPRVKAIRVSVANDACPHCFGLLKTYQKDDVPSLPYLGCSHENGCRCFYEPVLEETALVGKVVK